MRPLGYSIAKELIREESDIRGGVSAGHGPGGTGWRGRPEHALVLGDVEQLNDPAELKALVFLSVEQSPDGLVRHLLSNGEDVCQAPLLGNHAAMGLIVKT